MDVSSTALAAYARSESRRQYEALAIGVLWRIRDGSLSSDDAYAWVRIVIWDAKRLHLIAPDTHDQTPPAPCS